MKGYLPKDVEVIGDFIRWYFVPELQEYVPSVTSVLDRGFPKNPGLVRWFINTSKEEINKKSEEGRTKGTQAHEVIERTIKMGVNGKPNFTILSRYEKGLIQGFINWFEANDVVFISQEEAVYYCEDGITTAGRFDAVAKVNGVEMVLDWKRSKAIYEAYLPQIALYAKAADIKHAGILRLCEKNKCKYQFKEVSVEEHYKAFIHAFHLAEYLGIMKTKPTR